MTLLLFALRAIDAPALVLLAAAVVSYPPLLLLLKGLDLEELRELRALRRSVTYGLLVPAEFAREQLAQADARALMVRVGWTGL